MGQSGQDPLFFGTIWLDVLVKSARFNGGLKKCYGLVRPANKVPTKSG